MRFVPGLRPSVFRVILGAGMFALTLLLHLHLAPDGPAPALDTGDWAVSAAVGLLSYWLVDYLVFVLVALCAALTDVIAGRRTRSSIDD